MYIHICNGCGSIRPFLSLSDVHTYHIFPTRRLYGGRCPVPQWDPHAQWQPVRDQLPVRRGREDMRVCRVSGTRLWPQGHPTPLLSRSLLPCVWWGLQLFHIFIPSIHSFIPSCPLTSFLSTRLFAWLCRHLKALLKKKPRKRASILTLTFVVRRPVRPSLQRSPIKLFLPETLWQTNGNSVERYLCLNFNLLLSIFHMGK